MRDQGKKNCAFPIAENLLRMIRMMDVYGCSVERIKGFQFTEEKEEGIPD